MRVALPLCASVGLGACALVVDLGPERFAATGDATGSGGGVGTAGAGGVGNVLVSCDGQRVVWARSVGDTAAQHGVSIVPDGHGGVFVAGRFAGRIDLGGGDMVSAGQLDVFLARFDAGGHHVWSKRFGDDDDQGHPMRLVQAPGPAGGFAWVGIIQGTIDFGSRTLTSDGLDGIVARFDADGDATWVRALGGPGWAATRDAVFDDSGALWVGGSFRANAEGDGAMVDFDGQTLTPHGLEDAFLAKLAPDGAHVWSRRFGSNGTKVATNAIALDAAGRVVFAGTTDGHINLGTGILSYAGGFPKKDAFVATYQTSGMAEWSRLLGLASTSEVLHRLVRDPASEAILALGAVGMERQPHAEMFLWRLDGLGDITLAKQYAGVATDGGPFGPVSLDLAAAATGDVVLTTSFDGTVDLGAGPLPPPTGGTDALVAKLDDSFAPAWTLPFGSDEDDHATSVALDDDGSAFVIGAFRKTITLSGCDPMESAGDLDVILMKLAP